MAGRFALAVAVAAGLGLLAPASPARAARPQTGRAEALIFATTFGFYQGIATTMLLHEYDIFESGEAVLFGGSALTLATTAGTYFGAAAVTDRYGVNEAQASMFNSSLFWAVLNGVGGGVAADVETDTLLWSTLATGYTGQAIGILTAANVDRTAGQVGLMNTVGTWTGAEALLLLGAFGAEEGYSFWGTLAVDAGLVAGAIVSSKSILGRGISQERTRLLDLGAFAGGLAGPAALFMVWGPEENLRAWYLTAVAIGIPIGLGTAWYLTRDYDRADPDAPTTDTAPLVLPLAAGAF
jgi:hypothetical protein